MPGDLLSGALIEVARDLREKRVTARELIEAAIARHERFGERLHATAMSLLVSDIGFLLCQNIVLGWQRSRGPA